MKRILQSIALMIMCENVFFGAITNVQVVGTTATQALINYTWAPSTDVCKVEVSTSPTYSPLANDVDATQFTGANLDSRRPGAGQVGNDRQFVVGLRSAPTSLQGTFVSRALQAATQYYGRLTCPSTGGTTATFQFETTTIPYGSLYQDPPSNNFPTIPVNQRNFALPTTGGAQYAAVQGGGLFANNALTAASNTFTKPGATTSFTIMAMMNANSYGAGLQLPVSTVDGGNVNGDTSYDLGYGNGSNAFLFGTKDTATTDYTVNGTTHPTAGNWYCPAGTHDATTPTARVNKIWLNGVVEGTLAAGASIYNGNAPLGVVGPANQTTGTNWSVNGSVAMVLKVSALLTGTQQAYICNSGNGRSSAEIAAYLTAQSLPAADYLYEFTPTVATDASGNGTTLTQVGTITQGAGPNTQTGTPNPIIDPQTGIAWVAQLAPLYDTADAIQSVATSGITWSDPDGTSWINPTYITSSTAPGAQSVSGQTGLLIGHYALPNACTFGFSTSNNPFNSTCGSGAIGSLIFVQVTVTASAASAGQHLHLCMMMASQTACDPGSQTYVQAITTSSAPYTFGTGANGDMMRTTFGVGIPSWALQATNGINFAIFVDASTNIVSITSVTASWNAGAQPVGNDGGGYYRFSPTLVNGPDVSTTYPSGEPGYVFSENPLQYFIGKYTGRVHWVGSVFFSQCGGPVNAFYKLGDPSTYYCMAPSGGTLYKINLVALNPSNPWNDFPAGATPGMNTAYDFEPQLCGAAPCINVTTVTSSLGTLIQNFTSAGPSLSPVVFDPTTFNTPINTGTDQSTGYVLGGFKRGTGSFGQLFWAFVFDPAATSNASGGTSGGSAGNAGCIGGGNPGCVIAAVPAWAVDGLQWGTYKEIDISQGSPEGWMILQTYFANPDSYGVQMIDGVSNGDGSVNQLTGTAHSSCSSPPAPLPGYGCDQITIQTNIPAPNLGTAYAPGNPLLVNSFLNLTPYQGQATTTEVMRVLSTSASNTPGAYKVVIERGANNAALQGSGSLPLLYMFPGYNQNLETNQAGGIAYWNYSNYPYGVDVTGNHLAVPPNPFQTGSHTEYVNGSAVIGSTAPADTRGHGSNSVTGYIKTGNLRSVITAPLAPYITTEYSPFNADGNASGGNIQSHMSGSFNVPIAGVGHPYQGFYGSTPANVCTSITGTLCKFSAANPPPGLSLPYSKISPLAAYWSHVRLTNISGPSSVIDGTTAHLNQVCVVSIAGECFSGSAQNEVYINAPATTQNFDFFPGQNFINADNQTLVVRNTMQVFNGIQEVRWPNVSDSAGSRLLTHGQPISFQSVFDSAQYTPDGGFVTAQMPQVGDGSAQNSWLVGKVPPEKTDNINRSTWFKQAINVPAYPGANGAYIEYGYQEFGSSGVHFYCSERQDNCVATTGTTTTLGSGANPFYYLTTDTFSPTGCTSGCTITLNLIPQRVANYEIFYTASGTVIGNSGIKYVVAP